MAKSTAKISLKKGVITGGIGAVLGLLIYSSIFPTGSFLSKLIMVIVTLICASLGYIMGSGLDTTKEAPKSRKAVRNQPAGRYAYRKGAGFAFSNTQRK